MSTKKSWGNITWELFHALAEKVDAKKFSEIKPMLINIIILICRHLPCPYCSTHAVSLLNKSYKNKINTKMDFIEFLRQFHNIVNIKLNKSTISEKQLTTMYQNSNLATAIQTFYKKYNYQQYNIRFLHNSFHKNNFLKNLNDDLNKIKYAYET